MTPHTWMTEQSMRIRLKYGLPLTPQMRELAARSKRRGRIARKAYTRGH